MPTHLLLDKIVTRSLLHLEAFAKKHYAASYLIETIVASRVFISDRLCRASRKRILMRVFQNEVFPLFSAIGIETVNRCNHDCTFCPVNKNADPRPYKNMDNALFYDIIDSLSALEFSGKLSLSSNNEPLLDKRLLHFAQYARERLPKVWLYFYTNGILLTVDRFVGLSPFVDVIRINNYSSDGSFTQSVREIYEYCMENPEYQTKAHIIMRQKDEIISNRAGNAPNRHVSIASLKSPCAYPFFQVTIRPDGKLSLCCFDAKGEVTLGDLNSGSLIDIWRSERYKEARRTMLASRKECSHLCEKCDFTSNYPASANMFHATELSPVYQQASE